jgi:hypothetical protein
MSPLEITEAIAKKVGEDIDVAGEKFRFLSGVTVPSHDAHPLEIIGLPDGPSKLVVMSLVRSVTSGVNIGLLFAIDLERYAKWVQAHGPACA